jgi:uncharacterized membrane protein
LIEVKDEASAAVLKSFLSITAWQNDLVDMFIVKEVCKKKTINPTLFKKKGANAPFKV